MTASKKLAANQSNALQSTGPRTEAGKAVAKMNAMNHGLRSPAPVVSGERPEDWDAFRTGFVTDLAPVGTFEAELVERIASLSWRTRRVVAYEAGIAVPGHARTPLAMLFSVNVR